MSEESCTRGVQSRGLANWPVIWKISLVLIPWVLLIAANVIDQSTSPQPLQYRLTTLLLVAGAGLWIYLGHTRVNDTRWDDPRWMAVFFLGILVWFVVLMGRSDAFVLFTISGFFLAFELRPWWASVSGIFGTSVVLNTMTMFPETAADAAMYVGVIAVQTVAIGAGAVVGEKTEEYDRQRDAMLTELERTLEENAGLHAQLLSQAREGGVLDERQRMAREIHDTLAQGLAGIITQVQASQRVWEDAAAARQHVDRALELARHSLTEARRSVQELTPQPLTDAQLPDALNDLVDGWTSDHPVAAAYEVTGEPVHLSPAIEVVLFRVAQEALTNVARHADADRAGVTLSYLGGEVLLDVRDDGRGIGPDPGEGFGLTSMRQRVRSVGGEFAIETGVGEGTAISARVPQITAAAEDAPSAMSTTGSSTSQSVVSTTVEEAVR